MEDFVESIKEFFKEEVAVPKYIHYFLLANLLADLIFSITSLGGR